MAVVALSVTLRDSGDSVGVADTEKEDPEYAVGVRVSDQVRVRGDGLRVSVKLRLQLIEGLPLRLLEKLDVIHRVWLLVPVGLAEGVWVFLSDGVRDAEGVRDGDRREPVGVWLQV